jgi:outer membrane protein OmpA-like peptidoglycan-associated protein
VNDFAGQTLKTGTGTMSFQIRDQVSETGENGHLQQYSLIVFDYDGAGISASHRKAIASIRSTLSTNADISVIGMTDVLGDEEYNRQLSTRRAQAIVAALNHPHAVAIGVGEQTGIPATTPEGRFYSRRVDVIIRSHDQ